MVALARLQVPCKVSPAEYEKFHYFHDKRRFNFLQLPEVLLIVFSGPVLWTDACLETFPSF